MDGSNPLSESRVYDRRPAGNPWMVWLMFAVVMILLLRESPWSWFWRRPVEPRVVTPRADLAADEQATIELFEAAAPSVVYVRPMRLERNLWNLNTMEVPTGTGSGFIWDDIGHIVTNYHVVQGADRYVVMLEDGRALDAVAVGGEPDKDVAVLRIDAPPQHLQPIAIGTSDDLRVGQKVFAIGNPFGLDFTLTTGVVSALNREIMSVGDRPIEGVIQTDAAINPGNSGGPLLDSAGRLIGVNTAIYSPSGSSAGIGFAVPVDIIRRVVTDIITHGRVIRPGLGVQVLDDSTARRYGAQGVMIRKVPAGSAAERAGLRGFENLPNGELVFGDVITAINGEPTRTFNDLLTVLERYEIGATVKVTVLRGRSEHTVEVTLQAI